MLFCFSEEQLFHFSEAQLFRFLEEQLFHFSEVCSLIHIHTSSTFISQSIKFAQIGRHLERLAEKLPKRMLRAGIRDIRSRIVRLECQVDALWAGLFRTVLDATLWNGLVEQKDTYFSFVQLSSSLRLRRKFVALFCAKYPVPNDPYCQMGPAPALAHSSSSRSRGLQLDDSLADRTPFSVGKSIDSFATAHTHLSPDDSTRSNLEIHSLEIFQVPFASDEAASRPIERRVDFENCSISYLPTPNSPSSSQCSSILHRPLELDLGAQSSGVLDCSSPPIIFDPDISSFVSSEDILDADPALNVAFMELETAAVDSARTDRVLRSMGLDQTATAQSARTKRYLRRSANADHNDLVVPILVPTLPDISEVSLPVDDHHLQVPRFGDFILVLERDDSRLLPTVINLSSVRLSGQQLSALEASLKFRGVPPTVPISQLVAGAESAARQLQEIDQPAATRFRAECATAISRATKPENNMDKDQCRILRDLSKKEDLIITNADKGGRIVVLEAKQYGEMCIQHLSDPAYQKVDVFGSGKGRISLMILLPKKARNYSMRTSQSRILPITYFVISAND